MKLLKLICALGMLSCVMPAFAASKTVTLSVPGMSCPVCPITVKKSLQEVNGVKSVNVDFDSKKAVVSFDDAKTSENALMHATSEAGYPSAVIK